MARGHERLPPSKGRVRLDQHLLDLGLETSRNRVRARILAGDVRLGDRVLDKPGMLVDADSRPSLIARSPFVSRGGEKLAGALDALQIDPKSWICADVGASTGGFTDCLLQRGAASILAIDVGYGQLAHRLRVDGRVRVLERTNIRHLDLADLAGQHDLVTADLSFISLRLVLPKLLELAKPEGRLLLMVKPQFELERADVASGGVVRDPVMRAAAATRVREAAEALGLRCIGQVDSTLPGPKGNIEIFLLLEPCGSPK